MSSASFAAFVNLIIQKEIPVFDADSRLLVIAPHPDDETLGCGITVQRAVRAGAAVRVVYATDGENNPWPQRFLERKWRLRGADRERWGKLRRTEARSALHILGVRASDVRFLGLPDQGLTDLLLRRSPLVLQPLADLINEWSPTHLLIPSASDTHPDHQALAIILRIVLGELVLARAQVSTWSYAIHGSSGDVADCARQDRQSDAETATKLRAIACHKTQLHLSRRRFLRYAARPERLAQIIPDGINGNNDGFRTMPANGLTSLVGSSRAWTILFAAIVAALGAALSANITSPWIGALDYNGAVWSQSAHNILRAGLAETSGASSGFYFGPLPIPAWGYYLHHPPLLHLVITALFYVFGEQEWVARLLPISCSLLSAVFLWYLVRSCASIRAATLAVAVFACLPMELRYGKMVNFEPVVLMLILGTLLSLRYWNLSGHRRWQYVAFTFILAGLWVDWAMHIFVVALSACWLLRSRKTRRFAIVLLLTAAVSGVIYLFRIRLLRPDAWENLAHTLVVRLGSSGHDQFTQWEWCRRIFGSLLTHFLPLGLALAAIGALLVFRARTRNHDLRWLGRACLIVFVMDALFVAIFRNDSYIHQYIAFYFLAPVAIMAGISLDHLITWSRRALFNLPLRHRAEVCVCLLLLFLGTHGALQTQKLHHQFRILDYRTPEPPNLIPELGEAIQKHFPPGTHVLCNFLPDYGPHLAYYAQRDILNNLSEFRFWQGYLNDASRPVGGVVWMTPAASRDLIAKLPPGSKQVFHVGDQSFCLWKRDQSHATKTLID